MDRDPAIERLLNAARDTALTSLEGKSATEDNLKLLANAVRMAVLRQADAGMWTIWGVNKAEDIAGVEVSATIRSALLNGPPIALEFDFIRTPLKHLMTSAAAVPS